MSCQSPLDEQHMPATLHPSFIDINMNAHQPALPTSYCLPALHRG
ncbi:unnamed protein product, partial [Staurois parvus]